VCQEQQQQEQKGPKDPNATAITELLGFLAYLIRCSTAGEVTKGSHAEQSYLFCGEERGSLGLFVCQESMWLAPLDDAAMLINMCCVHSNAL
jgi:hypothetical protein